MKFLSLLALFAVSIPATSAASAPFAEDIHPFFATYCFTCHGEKKQKGKVRFDHLSEAGLGGSDLALWLKIVEELSLANMPPEDEKQPTRAELDAVLSWAKGRLASAGHQSDIDHKMLQPGYGNLLNHEKLFDGGNPGPAFSPARLWRITPGGYDAFLKSFGHELDRMEGSVSHPFVQGTGKAEFANYAPLAHVDGATLSQLFLNCQKIAVLQTAGFDRMEEDHRTKQRVVKHYDKSPASFTAIITSAAAPTEEQLRNAVSEEFAIVLSRRPRSDELAAYVALLKQAIEISDKTRGLATMATAVLLQPEAIFRMEVGLGETLPDGRRRLSPYELAYALSYALTDTSPDQVMLGDVDRHDRPTRPSLMDLAEQGKLDTAEDVRVVATRIWEKDRIKKPRILKFFHEFFGYDQAGLVFKGDRAGKEFATNHLVKDADDLVQHVVDRDRDVLKELLTTDRFFFEYCGGQKEYDKTLAYIVERTENKKGEEKAYEYFVTRSEMTGKRPIPQANATWRETARFYNLDPEEWDYPPEQPFAMPAGQRVGLLTHPAWLAAWSGNFNNDPIRRGKWIREHLLAGTVPEVPITVDATIPEDPHKTLRQRLEKTRDEYCWNCHKKMNPLGLPFEVYDDFGQYRTEEGLGATQALRKPKAAAPLVTTGEIIGSGDPAIDGAVADVHDLMNRLANSTRVRQSFVRHAFRFWLGRNEMFTDSPTVMAADKAYVEQGGSFKALVISLLTSDSFLYRK